MQRKAYITGTAALLAALLAGCSSGSGGGTPTDDANPGDAASAPAAAQPGRYRTLPEPCGAVGHDTLGTLLPGIQQLTDPDQRDKAYRGVPALTYDTDRKVGCRWKVESTLATDRLSVDFERVVSYDGAVSDDTQAQKLFQGMAKAADLPVPSLSAPASPSTSPSGSPPRPRTPPAAPRRPPPPTPPRAAPAARRPPTSSPACCPTSVTRRTWTTSSTRPVRPPNPGR